MRRLVAAAGDVVVAVALALAAAAGWFALTWFPQGLVALVGSGGLAARLWARPLQRRRLALGLKLAAAALGVLGLGVVGSEIVLHAGRSEARLESRYLHSSGVGALLRVANVIPEGDLTSLGVRASGLLGIWPPEQMREVHGLLAREYRAMRADPAFAHAGNVAMSGFYETGNRHFFRYLPRGYPGGRTWPVLLFLHGAAGNLALYPWLWSRFADERGLIVVCPTWDNGEWWRPGGAQVALDALDDTLGSCSVDEGRVFLAGYSSGAIGGWAVLAARPNAFRGFVSIAGARLSRLDDARIPHVPVLLLHGAKDRVIPPAESRRLRERLPGSAELVEFPGEDHFIIIRSMGKLEEAIGKWMDATR